MQRRRRHTPWTDESAATPTTPTHCPYHDPPVELERGPLGWWCPVGGGYPLHLRRDEACPICRRPLEWDGGCLACHGTDTGRREDWCFPGQRYDRFDEEGQPLDGWLDAAGHLQGGQHWIRVEGPDGRPGRPAIDRDDVSTGLAAMQRVFAAKGWWRR